MKVIVASIIIAALLVVGYCVRPGIKSAAADYWNGRVEAIALDSRLTATQRHDSLLVLSLNFRHDKWNALSWRAIMKADSLMPGQPLTQGLIGLLQLEAGHKEKAIEIWRRGAEKNPVDPNLSYLAGLDTTDLTYVDNHMLEKMFVDTLINTRLKAALYHRADTDVIAQTEQNLRIQSSINTTFIGGAGLGLIAIYFSVRQMRRARKMVRPAEKRKEESKEEPREEPKEESKEAPEKTPQMPKSVSYIVVISCVLKIGQILAAMYRYFTLGTNVSNFVSKYVLIPENLWELFTSNIVFALIFIVMAAWAVFRKKLAGLV